MAPLIKISIINIYILFVFHAEARWPMPLQNKDCRILSLENMRVLLSVLEYSRGREAWPSLSALLNMIHGTPSRIPECEDIFRSKIRC